MLANSVALWRLLAFILGLTGRILGVVLGLVLVIVGIVVSLTVVGAIVGIRLAIFGFMLMVRGLLQRRNPKGGKLCKAKLRHRALSGGLCS